MKFSFLQLPFLAIVAAIGFGMLLRTNATHWLTAATVMSVAVLLVPLRLGGLIVNGLQDFHFEGLVQIVGFFVGVSTTVTLAYFFPGVGALSGGWIAQIATVNFLTWSRILLRYRTLLPTVSDLYAAVTPISMLGTGGWAWMSGLGVTLLNTADVLVVGYLYEESLLFNYSCTTKLIVVLTPLALTLGPAMIPGLTELRSSQNVLGMERMTLIYSEIVLAISGFFGCLVVALNSPFVNCWLGSGRYLGDTVTLATVLAMNLKHFLSSTTAVVFSLGMEKTFWRLTFILGWVTVAVTWGIVAIAGAKYAAFGPFASMAFYAVVAVAIIHRHAPSLGRKLISLAFTWLSVYSLCIVACWFAARLFTAPNFGQLIVGGIVTTLCYGLILLVPLLRSEAWAFIRRKLKEKGRWPW